MADTSREESRDLEVYGELGLVPKVGFKLHLSRRNRVDQMLESAAEHAGLDEAAFEVRVSDATDRVRDVLLMAAVRAQEVDDTEYLDALGRLVAGALDPAVIDEIGYVMAEIVRLEPVHLRALLDFFQFGREDEENATLGLTPTEAAWARARPRADRAVAAVLGIARETAAHVLLRLERDGLIELHTGPIVDGEPTSGPTDWGCRVLSLVFPDLELTCDSSELRGSPTDSSLPATSSPQVDVITQDHRAVLELESEIKQVERGLLSPVSALSAVSGDAEWLRLMKRRLRSVDPDNPWAREDW